MRCFVKSLVAILLVLITSSPGYAGYNVWLDNSLTKYRQDGEDGQSGPESITIGMAKNEIESFQIMLYADGETLNNVDITVSDLSDGSATISDIYLYKQHYVQSVNQSRIEYPLGWYPDALLPKVDRYFKETRNTFPFSVAAGKVQGVWVDVGTTADTPAGTYTGTVTITAEGKPPIRRTINVTVWNFALPSTSSFHSQFVFEQTMMTFGHGLGYEAAWNGTTDAVSLARTYMTAFLYHKIGAWPTNGKAMTGTNYLPWNDAVKELSVTSWEPWYSIVRDSFSGTAITSGPYSGAKVSAKAPPHAWPVDGTDRTDIATADKESASRQYMQHVWDKFTAEGWDPWNTLFWSVKDEPRCENTSIWRGVTMSDCDAVIDQAQDINSVNTGGLGVFKNIYANSRMRVGLEDFANHGFYSANSYTFVCPGWDRKCVSGGTKTARDTYPGYPNDEIWGYLACDNNGCWETGAAWRSGQIDWSADASALYNRFPGFIWAKYELTGTIYWQTTVDNYQGGGEPYKSIWYFGSNGDGHLIYPGVATASGRTLPESTPIIGGMNDIPIESIRMKHIRDAIEDWEYVQIAKTKAGKTAAFAALNTAFTDPDIDDAYWNLNMSASNFSNVRESLGALASGNGARRLSLAGRPIKLAEPGP